MKKRSVLNQQFYSFEGIPYAEPPLNDLRFKEPKNIKPWSNIQDCTKAGSMAVQKDLHTEEIFGSEDCLYLNVYCKDVG